MLVRCPHRLAFALLSPQPIASRRTSSTSTSSASASAPPPRSSVPSFDLLEVYRSKVDSGEVKWDDTQVRIVVQLRSLHRTLHNYTPPAHLLLLSQPRPPLQPKDSSSSSSSWWPWSSGNSAQTEIQKEETMELARVLSIEEELALLPSPRGVLLIGPPGSGKTMLLDMLFDHLEVDEKQRRHYHSFLLHIYRLIYEESLTFRLSPSAHSQAQAQAVRKGWKSVFASGAFDDPTSALPRPKIRHGLSTATSGSGSGSGVYVSSPYKDDELAFRVAKRLMKEEGWLILFDDLQLLDPPSTHLLRSVLLHFWRLGGVVLSTSNRVPEDLYTQGVMRKRMEGFLACLRGRCEVLEVDGGKDWRELEEDAADGKLCGGSWVIGEEEKKGFEERWEKEVAGRKVEPHTLTIYNRPVMVEQQTAASSTMDEGRVARFTFAEICETTLGPADYLTISSTYSTIFISDVPPIRVSMKNEARRLINLLDALYESRTRLHVHSLVPLSQLFFADANSSSSNLERDSLEQEALSEMEKEMEEPTRPNVSLYEYQELKAKVESRKGGAEEGVGVAAQGGGGTFANLAIFTGEDERFAFKRTLSRLTEMCNPSYRQRPWTPLPLSVRSWESPSPSPSSLPNPPISSKTTTSDPPRSAFVVEGEGDFASEASYDSRPNLTTMGESSSGVTGPREDAPRLKERHFWGVGEWGSGAGKWGKGVDAGKKDEREVKGG